GASCHLYLCVLGCVCVRVCVCIVVYFYHKSTHTFQPSVSPSLWNGTTDQGFSLSSPLLHSLSPSLLPSLLFSFPKGYTWRVASASAPRSRRCAPPRPRCAPSPRT